MVKKQKYTQKVNIKGQHYHVGKGENKQRVYRKRVPYDRNATRYLEQQSKQRNKIPRQIDISRRSQTVIEPPVVTAKGFFDSRKSNVKKIAKPVKEKRKRELIYWNLAWDEKVDKKTLEEIEELKEEQEYYTFEDQVRMYSLLDPNLEKRKLAVRLSLIGSIYETLPFDTVSKPFYVDTDDLIFEQGAPLQSGLASGAGGWVPLIVMKNNLGEYVIIDGYHRFQKYADSEQIEVIEIKTIESKKKKERH